MSAIIQHGAGVLTAGGADKTYSTLDPTRKSALISLSNGDLTAASTGSGWKNVQSNIGVTAGKWYFEFKVDAPLTALSDGSVMMGCCNAGYSTGFYPGQSAASYGWQSIYGRKFYAPGFVPGFWSTYESTLGVWHYVIIDADARTMAAGRIGDTPKYGPDAMTGTSAIHAAVGLLDSGRAVTVNFGQSPFAGIVPAGVNKGLYL